VRPRAGGAGGAGGASTVNGTTLDAGVTAVSVVAADGVTQVGSVNGATGVVTVPGAPRLLAEVDLRDVVVGDLSEGVLDLKTGGDGAAGTVTIAGVACPLNVGGSAGADSLAFDGTGLRNAKTANNATTPYVDIKIGALFDAAAYARVVLQLLVSWEDFDADTSAQHACTSTIIDRTPGTLNGGCRITHIQNNGAARASRASGNGTAGNDVAFAVGSRSGSYVRTFDIRGRTIDFAEEAGTAYAAPSAYSLRGSDNAESPEAAGTNVLDDCQAWWLSTITQGEGGTNDNKQYDFVLVGFRILVQDLATVPA
jgi:hypothetical protein